MGLNLLLKEKGLTKYRLSRISGVPKTTIADICAGRSSINRCSCRTVCKLAKALGCSMLRLMEPDDYSVVDKGTGLPINPAEDGKSIDRDMRLSLKAAHGGGIDGDTGLPLDPSHLECGLPAYLQESVERMQAAWEKKERMGLYLHFDEDYCELQSNINCAEVNQEITQDQAWYLREKYLGLEVSQQ